MARRVKSLPAMWETWVWSLGREDPLEKKMATQSSILAWKIPWTEKEPGGLQPIGLQRVRHNWETSLSLFWINIDKYMYPCNQNSYPDIEHYCHPRKFPHASSQLVFSPHHTKVITVFQFFYLTLVLPILELYRWNHKMYFFVCV